MISTRKEFAVSNIAARPRPLVLIIRDGWGANPFPEWNRANAVYLAKHPMDDQLMSEYPGFLASRRNYDVAQGIDTDGRHRSGVLESSWRAGGASSAELAALAAFAQNPALQIVEASAVEELGRDHEAPADAIIHREDPQLGPLLRYTVVKRKSSTG